MLSGRGNGAVGPEVIAVTAGAVASIFLLKYLLVRSERPSSSTASIEDDKGCKKPQESMFLLKRGARAGNSAAAEEAVDSSHGLVDRSTGEGIRLVSGAHFYHVFMEWNFVYWIALRRKCDQLCAFVEILVAFYRLINWLIDCMSTTCL